MTNQVNEVLEKIRDICDLKRLEFGAKVIVKDTNGKKHTVTFASDADYAGLVWDNGETGSFVEDWVVEIIGLPVQLNHLLWALDVNTMTGEVGEYSITMQGFIEHTSPSSKTILIATYNPQKSVEDNLRSNPELTLFIHNLICV